MAKEDKMKHCLLRFAHRTIVTVVLCWLLAGYVINPAIAADRFIPHTDGSVSDTQTGLMWAGNTGARMLNWTRAYQFCREYQGGGHSDWRLPTLAELEGLYDPGVSNRGGYHLPQWFDTPASSCWAAETRNHRAARFNYTYGTVYWIRQSFSGPSCVLPVRDMK